jgi:hypothetical protein
VQFVLRLFFYGVVHERLFEVMFYHLPRVLCRGNDRRVFFCILQPEGLHPGPAFRLCPGHERKEIHCLLDGVPGYGQCAIQGHELFEAHKEIACIAAISRELFRGVPF